MNVKKNKVQRTLLFTVLAVTKVFYRLDYKVPSKWYSFIDSLRVSSGVLHERLSFVDSEVEEEFKEKEELIEKQLGLEKYYSKDEIRELRSKSEDIKI